MFKPAHHLLIQVLFVKLVVCDDRYQLSNNITVNVSEEGLDDPSCILAIKHCHTLTYALGQISNMSRNISHNTKVTVNVADNQTIKESFSYTFFSKVFLNIKVVGLNNAFIIFENDDANLDINQNLTSDCCEWAWQEVGFIKHWTGPLPRDEPSLDLKHTGSKLSSLAILNCTIISELFVVIVNMTNLVINDTTIGQVGICPLITIIQSFGSSIVISNSNCSTCIHTRDRSILDININAYATGIKIVNCTFFGLKRVRNHYTYDTSSDSDSIINIHTTEEFPQLTIERTCFIKNYQLVLVLINLEYPSYSVIQVALEKSVISMNTATSPLVKIADNTPHRSLNVTLQNLSVDSNTVDNTQQIQLTQTRSEHASVIDIYSSLLINLANLSFTNNNGTALMLQKTQMFILKGTVLFRYNIGVFGGACALYDVPISPLDNNIAKTLVFIFEENKGIFGGALYLKDVKVEDPKCQMKLNFINNKAERGNSLYFAAPPELSIIHFYRKCSVNISEYDVSSSVYNLITNETYLAVIPGQTIYIDVSITDCFGSASSCTADVYLLCGSESVWYSCFDKHIRLNDADHVVVLTQTAGSQFTTVDTKLSLLTPQTLDISNLTTTVSLMFACRNNAQLNTIVHLNISTCPLGFIYNSSKGACKCTEPSTNYGTVICSDNLGIACIAKGYWYGPLDGEDNATTYVSAPCSYPECSYFNNPCPARMMDFGFKGDYNLLGAHANEWCSFERGGLLCRSCALGYQYTFLAVSCVADSKCIWWQPYLILIISFVFQVVIAELLLAMVRIKLTMGSGFLYGPMLFLAVISHLPLDIHPQYSTLRRLTLVITAIPLLNLEPFGLIPWCFFHPFGKIYNYSLRYLGPLCVLFVIVFTTLKARWCPRMLILRQNPRLKALCILMLLSFWSLADITMSISFTSTTLIHNGAAVLQVVALEPHIAFFSLEHLPIVILALLVLLVVIAPLLLILLLSPLLSRVINLTKIKPFLDEFQSCYKDTCRWYSGVYFIVWIGFVSMQGQSVSVTYIQVFFVILLSAHCLIQPYQSILLNIADALILADIISLLAFIQSKPLLTTVVFVHLLVLVPILCVGIWFVCVLFIKCGLCSYCLNRRQKPPLRQPPPDEEHPPPPKVPVQDVYLDGNSTSE